MLFFPSQHPVLPSCVILFNFFPLFLTRVGDIALRGRPGQGFSWRQNGGGRKGGFPFSQLFRLSVTVGFVPVAMETKFASTRAGDVDGVPHR